MPLVAHNGLPTFSRLQAEGQEILCAERAAHQDIRELHIGLLNLMPDAALQATERQFLRLIGSCNRIAQLVIHPFSVPGVRREGEALEHVQRYYEDFEDVRREGLDALIVTGANPRSGDITQEEFWDGMIEVISWARENVCSVLCSCLATHAVVKQFDGVERVRLPTKRWGVYSHRVTDPHHPLVMNINTRFDAPHSHVYEVTRSQVEAVGVRVLAESEEAGLHMAVSADGLRFVFYQGHPEYDGNSLLKEFKREVERFVEGERSDYPAYPENFFGPGLLGVLGPFRLRTEQAVRERRPSPEFPEALLAPYVDNTWTDTGKAMFNNWLGLIYQLTHQDRRIPFMDSVDPDDPLALHRAAGG